MPAILYGVHPETGQVFVDHSVDSNSAYSGATYGCDGWGASNASFGNLIRATAEINESIFPTRHEYLDLEPDTGGPGRFRGMPGSRYVKRVTAPVALFTYQVGMKYPMPGVAGGRPGSANRFTLRAGQPNAELVTHTAALVPLQAGEAFEVGIRRRRRVGRSVRARAGEGARRRARRARQRRRRAPRLRRRAARQPR
jgi:N-methylhydantoinase B